MVTGVCIVGNKARGMIMAYDHMVSLRRKDGSRGTFHVYGRPTPKCADVITLPIDGRLIKARVVKLIHDTETLADEAVAFETMET
jgi:hypothetical protein